MPEIKPTRWSGYERPWLKANTIKYNQLDAAGNRIWTSAHESSWWHIDEFIPKWCNVFFVKEATSKLVSKLFSCTSLSQIYVELSMQWIFFCGFSWVKSRQTTIEIIRTSSFNNSASAAMNKISLLYPPSKVYAAYWSLSNWNKSRDQLHKNAHLLLNLSHCKWTFQLSKFDRIILPRGVAHFPVLAWMRLSIFLFEISSQSNSPLHFRSHDMLHGLLKSFPIQHNQCELC